MSRIHVVTFVTLTLFSSLSHAEDRIWTGAVDNQFLTAGNWDGGLPNSDEDVIVIDEGDNLPVVIPSDAGTITIGGFQLGTVDDFAGHVVQNGGTLVVAPFPVDDVFTDFEYKSHIGDQSSVDSSWIMNNDAVMLYDAPLDGDGSGLGTDGENSFDLEIGARTGDGVGRLELHDNAILRISDDLKIGAEENGNGHVLLDGSSKATIGSGISVGENAMGKGLLEVGGNALLVSGNSADPGMSDIGRTNEGYLTLRNSTVTMTDSANVYIRSFQHRSGVANVTIANSSQLHIFDVFENEAPDLGNATISGDPGGPQRTSHIGGNNDGEINITIQDDGVFTVDSDLEGSSSWSGLAVSGGNNTGGNSSGGTSVIEVKDRGTFTVQQDLHLTLGDGMDASSSLRIVGPDAQVAVHGNLYFALDPDGAENLGSATLHSVITGNTHATVSVAGDADIANGALTVELDGYSPRGGESYTLLEAENLNGEAFLESDFTMAELAEGLDWELVINDKSVTLNITGMLEGLVGDFDAMNGLDINDINALVEQIESGGGDTGFDVNNDNMVNGEDVTTWLGLKSTADGKTFAPGDTDLNGSVEFADFLNLSGNFGQAGNWGDGNFDGANGVDFADFLALSGNFGAGAAATQSVPEPTAAQLFLATAVALCSTLRRRR